VLEELRDDLAALRRQRRSDPDTAKSTCSRSTASSALVPRIRQCPRETANVRLCGASSRHPLKGAADRRLVEDHQANRPTLAARSAFAVVSAVSNALRFAS
jgi:hypothetical protein